MKKERDIQKEILNALRERGGWWLNFHGGDPYMPRGIPDIIGCFEGRFYAFEVKREGEEPSPLQEHMLKLIRKAGGTAEVIYSADEALRLTLGERGCAAQ